MPRIEKRPLKRTYVDLATGDYIEQFCSEEVKKWRPSPFGKRWCKQAFEGYKQLAQSDELQGADLRVFMMVMPSIHDGNAVFINQAQLAKELRMKPSAVNRSVRKLLEMRVIERATGANERIYRLNPRFAWYGPDGGLHGERVKDWERTRKPN